MSYLEELKKQSSDLKAKESGEKERQARLTENFRTQVQPAMRKFYLYLREMVDHLNYIKPDTPVSYKLEGFGTVSELAQDEYLLSSYNDKQYNFFLRCFAHSKKRPVFMCKNLEIAKRFEDYLWANNIRFEYTQENDLNHQFVKAKFLLDKEFTGEFRFDGDYEASGIVMQIRNFDKIAKRQYFFKPEHFTDKLIDQFGRYVTRTCNAEFLEEYAVDPAWWVKSQKLQAERLKREERVRKLKAGLTEESEAEKQARQKRLEELHRKALEEELTKARESLGKGKEPPSESFKEQVKGLGTSLRGLFGKKE